MLLKESRQLPYRARAINTCGGLKGFGLLAALVSVVHFQKALSQTCGEAWQRPCSDGACKQGSVFYRPGKQSLVDLTNEAVLYVPLGGSV
jgi:hypothetical protein